MHKSSIQRMRDFVQKYAPDVDDLTVLDIGSRYLGEKCGSYRALFQKRNWKYIGADTDTGPNVDVLLDNPYSWVFPDNSFGVVISGQTFEHIEFPWLTIMEVHRVLEPGGLCCIIAPATGKEHRTPTDCWRIYSDGFRALAKWANLTVLECYTAWDSQWSDSVLIGKKE